MDVAIAVQPNGTADVQETFVTGPRTRSGALLIRVVDPPEADGLQLVSTAVDGAFRAGPQDGVTVTVRGATLTMRWQVPAGPPASHTLVVHYRAFAAVRIEEPRGYLSWLALGDRRGYDIAASRLSLTLPSGVSFYEGTGIAEAGWTVARVASGIVATRGPVPDGQAARILGEFDVDPARISESQWQVDEDRQWNLLPSYVTAAIFMFGLAAAVLSVLRHQYKRPRPGDALASDPQLDAERLVVARGLRFTAVVGSVIAVASGAFCYVALPRLGLSLQIVPASMLVVAAWFVIAAGRWDREIR